MTKHARKNVYFTAHSMRFLDQSTTSLSSRVNTVIDRYHEMLRRAPEIQNAFTEKERATILHACASIDLDPAAHIFASLQLAVQEHADCTAKLAEKLERLEPHELVLLAEWLEKQFDEAVLA